MGTIMTATAIRARAQVYQRDTLYMHPLLVILLSKHKGTVRTQWSVRTEFDRLKKGTRGLEDIALVEEQINLQINSQFFALVSSREYATIHADVLDSYIRCHVVA